MYKPPVVGSELKWHKAFNVDPVVGTKTICKITGKSERTVRSVFRLFLDGGIYAITTRNHYRPASELDKHQSTILENLMTKPVGSAKEAVTRIKQLTGITRSETRVKVFMKKIGLKYIKTDQVPAKANIEEQEEFLKKVKTCCK
ncbi:MAG: winged helix-turn-helix domain-containing protein [Thermoguttaceae bacterium]